MRKNDKSRSGVGGMRTWHLPLSSITLMLMLLFTSSCSKLLEKTNENGNNPSDIPLTGLLPAAEAALVYNNAADYSIRTSLFMQQIAGIGGFAVNEDKYDFATSNFDGAWAKTYGKTLINLHTIITKADGLSPRYAGIARVLTALSLGNLTDAYGDVPFSTALDAGNLTPTYDSQEQLYARIQELLTTAIADLGQTTGLAPGNDDLIFKGNTTRWIAVAWTLKARYALHLSKRNRQQAASEALGYLYDGATWRGLANNENDVSLSFGTSNNQASPWFTQDAGRPGWYGMGAYLIDLLNGDGSSVVPVDPRRAAFAAPRPAPAAPNTFIGSQPGQPSAASNIVGVNTYYGRANSPVSLLSYPEARFIEAEARLYLDESDPQLQVVTEQAVRASFARVTSATDSFASASRQTDYILKRVQLTGTADQKLNTIITQKYIALYLNPETWVDYRRTGLPAITPASGGATSINPEGAIPRRFAYPNSELTLNPHIPTNNSNLQTPRLWWDN